MKPFGANYNIDGKNYLAVYLYKKDVILALPEDANASLKGHISYKRHDRYGSVYVFDVDNPGIIDNYVRVVKDFRLDGDNCIISGKAQKNSKQEKKLIGEGLFGENFYETLPNSVRAVNFDSPEEVMKMYHVAGQTVFEGDKKNKLEMIALSDILDFCGNKVARGVDDIGISTVQEIISKTKLNRINVERILEGGKQWFVKRCRLEANIDFSDGCITGWVPFGEASFDGKYFHNYFTFPWGECWYCYSKDKHESFPETIHIIEKPRLIGELNGKARLKYQSNETLDRPVKVLRFGKRTESWTPFTENEFIMTLEAMTETGTSGIIPTKLLPFNKEIAGLLKRTDSTLLSSLSKYNEFEIGAKIYGSTNEFRMEHARKYNEEGVNTMYYLLCTPHLPPSKSEKNILKDADRNNIQVQILPLRIEDRESCDKLIGEKWDFLKDKHVGQSKILTEGNDSSYIYLEGNLVVKKIHPEWKKLIGDNRGKIKMCHHDDSILYCGGCSLKGGGIFPNWKLSSNE